jgi:hypothetical protein
MKNNSNKFKKELTEKEILIIESMVKQEMKFFDYDFETKADWSPTLEDSNEIKAQRKERKEKIKKEPVADLELLISKAQHTKDLKAKLMSEEGEVNFELIEETSKPQTKVAAPQPTLKQLAKQAAKIVLKK